MSLEDEKHDAVLKRLFEEEQLPPGDAVFVRSTMHLIAEQERQFRRLRAIIRWLGILALVLVTLILAPALTAAVRILTQTLTSLPGLVICTLAGLLVLSGVGFRKRS